MRRTMPSAPGAVETCTRSASARRSSMASVRSIAEASRRTLTASTAPAAATPSRTVNARAASAVAARKNAKRQPPSSAAGASRPDVDQILTQFSRFLRRIRGLFGPRRVLAHPRDIPLIMSNRCGSPAQQYSFVFSKGQDDLADVLARLHASVGFGGFAQREGRVDYRLDPASR